MHKRIGWLLPLILLVSGCYVQVDRSGNDNNNNQRQPTPTREIRPTNIPIPSTPTALDIPDNLEGETGRVTHVIDGDTIDVLIDGQEFRVRYVGVNTPERDESCYADATAANRRLVENQTVRLVRDTSETDRYGRLLRFIYVGNTFVNQTLVAEGYAEAVLYEPDDEFHDEFVQLERVAIRDGLGCHPTGIFDDNSTTR